MLAQSQIILVRKREEVHARLMLQVVSFVVDAVGNTTIAVEIIFYDVLVGITKSFENLIVG